MSIERTIVQKLFESRGLAESEFQAGGSTYKCVFGKYYKDGEQISRDEYFKAKDGGSVSGSAPRASAQQEPKVSTKSPNKTLGITPEDGIITASEAMRNMFGPDLDDPGAMEMEELFSDYAKILGCKLDSMFLIDDYANPDKYSELIDELENKEEQGGYATGTIRGVPVVLDNQDGLYSIYYNGSSKNSDSRES